MQLEPVLPRIARGDHALVATCLARYGGLVAGLARRLLPAAEVDDAVQEVFTAVWKAAGRFDPGRGSEAAFVAVLARRRLIDRLRRLGARPQTTALPAEEALPASATAPTAELREQVERARRALAALKPGDRRRVLELILLRGYTQTEVAAALGLPLGTVKTHARRGLAQLRAELGEVPA
ncbi:MAG: sigma-70 family RNA polymerase sigma factor [Planctomycetes bacterium]|nr:sigma-70 family RNA polymerase sigma factor [Planctomycetota bacterium]